MLEGTVTPGMHTVIDVDGQKIVFTPDKANGEFSA